MIIRYKNTQQVDADVLVQLVSSEVQEFIYVLLAFKKQHWLLISTCFIHYLTLKVEHGYFIMFKRQTVWFPITVITCNEYFVTTI